MIGQCKLCLKNNINLQESHFIPKGIYKRLREKNEKNPNPVMISNKVVVQTSSQIKAFLLCPDCEKRLNKNGEYWVLGHCLQEDASFPLAAILSSRVPDNLLINNQVRVYCASNIPEINISALAYFAASIFWRGSVYAWNIDGSFPVGLGPFQEQFREYLMDLKAFPQDCALLVMVREGKESDRLTHTPVGGRHGKFHLHNFSMPGFVFILLTSKNIPAKLRNWCIMHGHNNPIIMTALLEKILIDTFVSRISEIKYNKKTKHRRNTYNSGDAIP
jgi:hypothetical protein